MKCAEEFMKKYLVWIVAAVAPIVLLVVTYFSFAFYGLINLGAINRETWLIFLGGFLAFYGSVFLGCVR